ncbi:MAG: hypothetical protein M3Z30_05800 [Gemmatimonadota bacterium]|nr:hypothetical protein [Gemmatimonadota bacterium]
MKLIRSTLATTLILVAAACSSSPSPSTGAEPAAADRVTRNADIITSEELADPVVAAQDALTAIRQLRPAFFRTRGPMTMRTGGDPNQQPGSVQMSQDFGPLHPLSELAGIGVRTLVEVRYLNANEAQARFGINANGGPVIVVLTSKQ